MGEKKIKDYTVKENEDYYDLVDEPSYKLYFCNEENRQNEEGTLRVLSLFSGCGGKDIGLEGGFICHKHSVTNTEWIHHSVNNDWVLLNRNLFRTVFACDILEEARLTWLRYMSRYNVNPDIYHLNSIVDLVKMHKDGNEIFPTNIDIVTGGFPCQEFSSCGPLGGLESERGRLYQTLIAYMNTHKPKIVVGENVINLERMEKGEVLKTIQKDLAATGYSVKVWKMFAPDYGVPQRRTRLIIMCVRKDIFDEYGFPEEPEARFKDDHRSIEWAIGDLVDVTDNSVPNQGDYFGASKAKKGNGQGDESNKKDKPAYTIRANPKSRVQFHYSLDRRLTVRECARIQTFPDDFVFKFSKTVNISQIGNAVPPIMAYLVAQSVKNYLDKIGGVEK